MKPTKLAILILGLLMGISYSISAQDDCHLWLSESRVKEGEYNGSYDSMDSNNVFDEGSVLSTRLDSLFSDGTYRNSFKRFTFHFLFTRDTSSKKISFISQCWVVDEVKDKMYKYGKEKMGLSKRNLRKVQYIHDVVIDELNSVNHKSGQDFIFFLRSVCLELISKEE